MKEMSSSIPKVAVITRTKDRNLLLRRALTSVREQSYKDYVHIIVNDGGDPKEVDALVRAYGSSATKCIHNKDSEGLTHALNQGIKSVNSQYIAILDDDDSWHHDFLQQTVDYLDRQKAPGVMTIIDRVIEEIYDKEVIFKSKNRWLPGVTEISLYKQCLDQYLATVGFVYRRSVYDELEGYDEDLEVAEDWDFGIRFLLKYDINILQTEEALAYYHHRPEAKGSVGNSVFDRVAEHKHALNRLANRYLRHDLHEGRYGIGVIMNELMYKREQGVTQDEKSLERVVRLEGHINYVAKEQVNGFAEELDVYNKKLINQLHYSPRNTLLTLRRKIRKIFNSDH